MSIRNAVLLMLVGAMMGCSSSPLSQARGLKEQADKEVTKGAQATVDDNYELALQLFDSALSKYRELSLTYGVRGEMAHIQAQRAQVLRSLGKCQMAAVELRSAVRTILTDNSVDILGDADSRISTANRLIVGPLPGRTPACVDGGASDYRDAGYQALAAYRGQAGAAAQRTSEAHRNNAAAEEAARAEARRERAQLSSAVVAAAAIAQQGNYSGGTQGVSPTSGSGKVFWGEQTGCARFAMLELKGNAQWFSFTNGCSMPIVVRYTPGGRNFSRMSLAGGETGKSWYLTTTGGPIKYVACSAKAPNGESINIEEATNRCYYLRR